MDEPLFDLTSELAGNPDADLDVFRMEDLTDEEWSETGYFDPDLTRL